MSNKVKLPGHHHPILVNEYEGYESDCSEMMFFCASCGGETAYYPYYCKECNEVWHKNCLNMESTDINHPCHHHPLKVLSGVILDYTDGKCSLCRENLSYHFYHCSTCNFSLDLSCRHIPKLEKTIGESKSHNHPLTLMAREVSFHCNVCGMHGERNPYVCTACSFMVHHECINRPHIININRHDHRISHTDSLGLGNRTCGICRQKIDWLYGAYSCPKCPEFFVHSKCATRDDVWDGEELEGVPEEEEDEPMFVVIGENVINHIQHPCHNLRLIDDGVVRDEGVRCQLCEDPIYSDKFYSCVECDDYILHETCANLTSRKRHGLYTTRISLQENSGAEGFSCCKACYRSSSGSMYVDDRGGRKLDLRCASVDWSCDHDCHPHTLFLITLERDTCGACNTTYCYVLRCVECHFNLCYECATYPTKIMHRCDDHPLVLNFGDKEQHGTYWCTVCETKADPKKWFYECEKCGIVCHIHCVLGDFANVKPGPFTDENGRQCEVVRNNSARRPHCWSCSTRCLVPFIYYVNSKYFCSSTCVDYALRKNFISSEDA